MHAPTSSAPPLDAPNSDGVVASVFEPDPPLPAFDSAWERLLTEANTEVLHTWIDGPADRSKRVGDVA